jgi:gliding motility-associated protein GldC
MNVKKSRIIIEIELDEKKVPENISWKAEDDADNDFRQSKAFILSLFDKESKDTLQMDLWTKEMQVIEMDRFVFQTLNSITDMYFRATRNTDLANNMKGFCNYFGEKTGIISNKGK